MSSPAESRAKSLLQRRSFVVFWPGAAPGGMGTLAEMGLWTRGFPFLRCGEHEVAR